MNKQVTPQQMTVICNIQQMIRVIGAEEIGFDFLCSKSYDELHEMQNELVLSYNNSIKSPVDRQWDRVKNHKH
jgi:hypothetical protein